MANWSNLVPSIENLYTEVIGFLKDRTVDTARWFSTVYPAPTNPVTGMVRWNDTNNNWEKFDEGYSSWISLTRDDPYGIDITGNAGTADAALTAVTAANAERFGGSLPASYATAAQGTKADAALPSAQFTGLEIRSRLLAVDGPDSGLDADLLDGQHASYFAPITSPNLAGVPTAPTAVPGTTTQQLSNCAFVSAAVAAAQAASGVPVGTVIYSLATSAPYGYLLANGAAIPRAAYSALFALIGTTYGAGNGSSTFNLPNLCGEFVRCWDGGNKGADPEYTRGVGSSQGFAIQQHAHSYFSPAYGPNTNSDGAGRYVYGSWTETGYTGGGETRPRNIALPAYIKVI
jgi:hypothetical protein